MRIALLNTPRSGSTWLRCLLRSTFNLEERTAFVPGDIDWDALPRRGVVHLHVRRTQPMLDLLKRHALRPVVVRRHPLDVLISILHFAPHEPATARWLAGEAGDERLLWNAEPMSEDFLRYATSARAMALLSLSPAWAAEDRAVVVGYERLVAKPLEELNRIAAELSARPVRDPREAIDEHALAKHRAVNRNRHYWRGQPGLWRKFLTSQVAEKIAAAQREAFHAFGYECDADPHLTPQQAEFNWAGLRAA